MSGAKEICDVIGRAVLADAVGVHVNAVGNAAWRDVFPTAWYLIVRELAAERGVECPESAFAFRRRRSSSRTLVGGDAA